MASHETTENGNEPATAAVLPQGIGVANLARVMHPSDANVAGNIHGGTILKMIEEAAGVAARRFMNSSSSSSTVVVVALTARVESVTFHKPMHVGDVAKVHAQVVFTTKHTVAVAVRVAAERLITTDDSSSSTGGDIVCNRALLWMVGKTIVEEDSNGGGLKRNVNGIATVSRDDCSLAALPPAVMPGLDEPDAKKDPEAAMAYRLASMAYTARKHKQQVQNETTNTAAQSDLLAVGSSNGNLAAKAEAAGGFTPDQSHVELSQVMLPSDCVTGTGLVGGGVVMKLMDNACGLAAVRHCGTNVVTVSADAIDLIRPVLLGDVLRVQARPTFASAKSLEVQVVVSVERFFPLGGGGGGGDAALVREEIVTTREAFFTFVSLPLQGPPKPLPIRPLVVAQSEKDKAAFEQGKKRYELRKQVRAAGAAS